MSRVIAPTVLVFSILLGGGPAMGEGPTGYYRQPALHNDTIVFVAEGDLWKVPADGGAAVRLTTHPGEETTPAISPDGGLVAFVARYEGPTEVYTMPIDGGRPTRRTYGIDAARVTGWTPEGKVLFSTDVYSGLPNWQLATMDVSRDDVAAAVSIVPLAQAADGGYDDAGRVLFFTRLPFQGSHTKRYQGGTAQNIWRFAEGDEEATPLTADYPGTSKRPMWWRGRVYFASDRDGTMNLWSMNPDGGGLRPHTRHTGWEVKTPSLHNGRIVYQRGADLHVYDIGANRDRLLGITLESDLDETREHWIDKPIDYLTDVHLSPDGDRVALTARGRVFVVPHRQGRLVEVTRREGVRYRGARFMPDGQRLVALSDETGEIELWTLPANGVGPGEQLTHGGEVLRWEGLPSPDGRWIAHRDKNLRLFVYDLESNEDRQIDESEIDNFRDLAWSPDGAWLAYVAFADNRFRHIRIYGVKEQRVVHATTDRFDSYSPSWSPDGKWLYFLSDRNLRTIVGSPWGNYQPEPFLDKKTRIYHLALREGLRSPFAPRDELHAEDDDKKEDKKKEDDTEPGDNDDKESDDKEQEDEESRVEVVIDLDGLAARLHETSAPAGNYSTLSVNDSAMFWRAHPAGESKSALEAAKITNIDFKVETVVEDTGGYELSKDGKKLLVRKKDDLYIIDAKPKKADLDKKKVNLSKWKLSVDPREEWRQMFVESWRLERDYFYDRGMHGVDWKAMLNRYLPLVERVTTRPELSDLMAQMVSELAALHTYVGGGDMRSGDDDVQPASLGAVLRREPASGGYLVEHVYRTDPDDLERRSPLAHPDADVGKGDVIEMINGTPALSVADLGMLLRDQAGRQVLVRVKPASGDRARDVIVTPITLREADNLRYTEWEYTRRLKVEELGAGEIGYVHLRAMSGRNFTEWAREYYPIFNRKGLIVDVRHNRGGNIDSWIIGRLLRKAWFYWSQRIGQGPEWNMQYAFRGHVAVLCNERTASDGEAFTEGVKRLELGRVFGTRTWGGEIWLSFSNRLVDRAIASAAESGVYSPEGEWLIEGWGVEPDVVVDKLPHATFLGRDAQLEAAIEYLNRKIEQEPVPDLVPPEHPDKSLGSN
ncbi:MAG: S41 family peptidase [Planctomycetota bacterium]